VLAATAPSKSNATKSLPLIGTALPGFDYTTWYAMYAPLATPKPVVDAINGALTKALKTPALVAKIEAAGTELQAGSPEEVQAWTQRDTEKWSRVIRDAKIAIE
jgi:tripartite-type tricarboxylate transporter receptor subunit TctC